MAGSFFGLEFVPVFGLFIGLFTFSAKVADFVRFGVIGSDPGEGGPDKVLPLFILFGVEAGSDKTSSTLARFGAVWADRGDGEPDSELPLFLFTGVEASSEPDVPTTSDLGAEAPLPFRVTSVHSLLVPATASFAAGVSFLSDDGGPCLGSDAVAFSVFPVFLAFFFSFFFFSFSNVE